MQDVTLFFFHPMILFIRKMVRYFQGQFWLKLTILHIRIVEVHGGSKVTDLLVSLKMVASSLTPEQNDSRYYVE